MAKLLFRLNGVPEDEAEDIRQLLSTYNIAHYETSAGFFGLGVAAIWLSNPAQEKIARDAIDSYQSARAEQQRAIYEQQVADGEIPGFGQWILQHPFRFTGIVLLMIFVLGLTLLPFWLTF